MMDGLIERGNPFICVLAVEIPDLNIKHIQNFIMCRPILDAELLIHNWTSEADCQSSTDVTNHTFSWVFHTISRRRPHCKNNWS